MGALFFLENLLFRGKAFASAKTRPFGLISPGRRENARVSKRALRRGFNSPRSDTDLGSVGRGQGFDVGERRRTGAGAWEAHLAPGLGLPRADAGQWHRFVARFLKGI